MLSGLSASKECSAKQKMGNLVYIHKGYSWYVPLALRNGRRFYGRNVHYIGDAYGCFVARVLGVRAHRLKDYHKSADKFSKIYRHHSNLGYAFELFCIQRWFVLSEFLQTTGMNSCVYLDTDVLLTQNLSELTRQTAQFGMVFTGYSAHVCFINQSAMLCELTDFINSFYLDVNNEQLLESMHKSMVERAGSGGVSDMDLFYMFREKQPTSAGSFPEIFGQSPIDGSLADTRGFKDDGRGFKKLIWNGGRPSAVTGDGKIILFAALHHQGKAKSIMNENYRKLSKRFFVSSSLVCFSLNIFFKMVSKIWKLLCTAPTLQHHKL